MWLALFNDVSTTGEHHCPSPLSIDEHGTEGDLLRFPFGMIPYTGKCAFYTSLISSYRGQHSLLLQAGMSAPLLWKPA